MTGTIEYWTTGICPVEVERQAADAEEMGWDGLAFFDSQNVGGDCYAATSLAARATSTLRVGTGVTNPFTRHPAVTASAAATVQELSGGRLTLGIGRGDSALAHLGFSPVSVAGLERYVDLVRRYVRRQVIPFSELADFGFGAAPSVDELGLGHNVEGSQLVWWLASAQEPPPVEVTASGPRAIAMAAAKSDRVGLTVGADSARLRWAIEIARAERADVPTTAYVNVVCHPDPDVALDLIRGPLAAFARFSVMHGTPTGPLSEAQKDTMAKIAQRYDMANHGEAASTGTTISDEFARQYGVVGDAETCVARIRELIESGVSRLIFLRPDPATPFHLSKPDAKLSQTILTTEVIPALREVAA